MVTCPVTKEPVLSADCVECEDKACRRPYSTNDKGYMLFLDMDGTIAKFYESERCLEQMFEAGFFETLNPYTNVVTAIKMLSQTDLNIVSAVDHSTEDQMISEKNKWLDRELPQIPLAQRHYLSVGVSKANLIMKMLGRQNLKGICLLDDYNYNLVDWQKHGGIAIKMVNEINDQGRRGPLWQGYRVRYDWDPGRLASEIKKIMVCSNLSA